MDAIQPAQIVTDLTLARRLERAEARANAEFVEARTAAFSEVGGQWFELAGVYAMYDGTESPCTQTFGLGMFEPVTGVQLDEIEQFFTQRGAPVFHEVCPLADSSLLELLSERGYRPIEYSNVLYRSIEGFTRQVASGPNPLRARIAEPGDAAIWAQTAAEGWGDVAPEFVEFILSLEHVQPHRPGSPIFLAELDGQAIAAGALSLFEGVALLAGASTIPKWRNRGAQRALLAHRLQYGAEHGCDVAMMVAAPGSTSQRNAERAGFRIAYTRTKWRLN